jgi:hypothetical protein
VKQTHSQNSESIGLLIQPRHGKTNCRHTKNVLGHRLATRTKKLESTPWGFFQHTQFEKEINNMLQFLLPYSLITNSYSGVIDAIVEVVEVVLSRL